MTPESGGMDTEGHSRDFPVREQKREIHLKSVTYHHAHV